MAKPYIITNGVKKYIDFEAGNVKFTDGDSFQDKLDKDLLRGGDGVSPTVSVSKSGTVSTVKITDKNGDHTTTVSDGAKGDKGDTGPKGSDASVTRSNVVNALGYTPARTSLSVTEIENMISSGTIEQIKAADVDKMSLDNSVISTLEAGGSSQNKYQSAFVAFASGGIAGFTANGKISNESAGGALGIYSSNTKYPDYVLDGIWLKCRSTTPSKLLNSDSNNNGFMHIIDGIGRAKVAKTTQFHYFLVNTNADFKAAAKAQWNWQPPGITTMQFTCKSGTYCGFSVKYRKNPCGWNSEDNGTGANWTDYKNRYNAIVGQNHPAEGTGPWDSDMQSSGFYMLVAFGAGKIIFQRMLKGDTFGDTCCLDFTAYGTLP